MRVSCLTVYAITILSSLVCLKVCPFMNDIQVINEALYLRLYTSNLVISLCATIVFFLCHPSREPRERGQPSWRKKFGDTIFNTSLDGVFIIFTQPISLPAVTSGRLKCLKWMRKREIEGTTIEKWFEEDHIRQFEAIEEQVASGDKNWGGELAFSTKNGRTFPRLCEA